MASNDLTASDAAVINVRLEAMQRELAALSGTTKSVADSLVILVRLEESHKTVLDRLRNGSETMQNHETRLQDIERDMPGLKELRRWVIGGILAGVGMMGVALAKLVLIDPLNLQRLMALELSQQRGTQTQPLTPGQPK